MKKVNQLPKSRAIYKVADSTSPNIFSPEEFKALVKYERARADRNGSIFSIIVFDLGDPSSTIPAKAISIVAQFSRSIDCLGFEEGGHIVVLLPDTVKQGADSFGKKVLAELGKIEESTVHYEIYSYPDNWVFLEKRPASLCKFDKPRQRDINDNIELFFIDKIPVWKRALDVTGASFLLLITSPIFLVLGIYIKIVSPGPVFFKQTRIGYKGIPFDFWKFRTMKCGNDQSFHGDHAKSFILDGDVPMEKLDNRDPRIFFGGRVIRKCCLDELPQLWNVIKGEMSLVGPRPCIPYEAAEYLRWHTHRFDVLPGLSGLWQVSGKNKLSFKQMVRLDIAYCSNITLLGDLAIIFRTPFAIMKMVFEAFAQKLFWSAAHSGKALENIEQPAERQTAMSNRSLATPK